MSMTRDDKIKCDECGKFIGVQDLIDRKALHHCVAPDSEFSDETFESLCAHCISPDLVRILNEDGAVVPPASRGGAA